MNEKIPVQVYLEPNQKRWLERRADESGKSRARIVRELIIEKQNEERHTAKRWDMTNK